VSLAFGIVTSPGSTVLFTGKLMMLFLLYIREDAVVVRQPIYALLMTFDQVAFFAGLHMLTGAGADVLLGGWIAKMAAVAVYTCLAGVYLLYFERPVRRRADMPGIFDTLTYRERYEDLLARTGCDALIGALDRHSLEAHGRRAVELAAAGRPLALLLIDIDHFKAYNDRFGHVAGTRCSNESF